MWDAIRPQMVGWHAVRIESRVTGSGTPDVNYNHGWIELKYKAAWPKREATPLRIEHYTREQRAWAQQRTAAGGRVFLLLKVGEHEWLLFRGATAAEYVGTSPRVELYRTSLARWARLPKQTELASWLLPS